MQMMSTTKTATRKTPTRRTLTGSALILGIVLATPLLADGAAGEAPPCQCRDPAGERRDLGTVACFPIGGRSVRLRCEMSTNTPYWKRLDAAGVGCPLAFGGGAAQPSLDVAAR